MIINPQSICSQSQDLFSFLVGHDSVGTLWFAIWLQLFLILGVIYTLASDSIAMHRFQIVAFGSVAIVFAVIGVNQSIFSGFASLDALAAGWLILAMVDILWVLYFTSEEDSLALYLFNSLGTGGLTPPSRRRRTRTTSMHNSAAYGGGGGYTAAGIGPGTYDTKLNNNSFVPDISGSPLNNLNVPTAPSHSQKSHTSIGAPASPVPTQSGLGADTSGPQGVNSPLMSTPGNAGIGAGGGPPLPADSSVASDAAYPYRAKALYACACQNSLAFTFDLTMYHRYRVPRRPQRNLILQRRNFGYYRQEWKMVAGAERGRRSR
jgi:SHO1 osmosensor